MNLKKAPRFAPRRQLIDDAMDGYVTWREHSAEVNSAYQNWRRVDRIDRDRAFDEYLLALDREEDAATEYRRLIEKASVF